MSFYSAYKSAYLSLPNHLCYMRFHRLFSSGFRVNHIPFVTDSLNKKLTATAEAAPVHLLNHDYITNEDIIRLLPKTNKNTIKHWRRTDPTFPSAYKVGKYNYYSKAKFASWFASHEVKNPELALVPSVKPATRKAKVPADRWGN